MSGSIYLPGISSIQQSTRTLATTLGSSVFKAVSSASNAALTNLSRLVEEYRGAPVIGPGPLIVGDFDFYDHIPVGYSQQEASSEEAADNEGEQDAGQASAGSKQGSFTDPPADGDAPNNCPPEARESHAAHESGGNTGPQLSSSTATSGTEASEFEVVDEEALQGYDTLVAARPAPDLPPLTPGSWAALQDTGGWEGAWPVWQMIKCHVGVIHLMAS
jgi:hypothetical protein